MNPHGDFEQMTTYEPFPGVVAAAFSTDRATFTRYVFDPGAGFPLHHHEQEQVIVVEEGEVDFTVDGETQRLGPGGWSVVRPNLVHGLRAGDAGGQILCVVSPPRDRNDDYQLADRDQP